MFTHRYRLIFAFLLSLYTYINTEFCKVYYYFNIRVEWYYAFATILLITFLILESNRIIEPTIRKMVDPEKSKTHFPVVFFVAGSFLSTLIAVGVVVTIGTVMHYSSIKDNITPLKLNLMYAWLINLLFHLINTIVYYFQEYKTTRIEAEELKRISVQAELQLVKSQINPHFLFNNLNVLSALVMKNNTEANRFIEEFCKVYRYILTNHDKEIVALKTELDYIKPYIFLLEKRFGEGLSVSIDIPVNYHEHFIIPASLQMLIENAIKHNIVSKNKPLHINIHSNSDKKIVVSNNLQLKQLVEKSTEFGLQNIVKRYQLVSDKVVSINKNEKFFAVSIPLLPMFTNGQY
jgi:two-component system, LytTR family, sensor kinase